MLLPGICVKPIILFIPDGHSGGQEEEAGGGVVKEGNPFVI